MLTTLANYWSSSGHAVELITFASAREDFYSLDARVSRNALELAARSPTVVTAILSNTRRLLRLRRALIAFSPDVVVSFLARTSVMALTAAAGTGIPVVISERSIPWLEPIGRFWSTLQHHAYPRAAAFVAQTEAVRSWARSRWPLLRIEVLENPLATPLPAGPDSRLDALYPPGSRVVIAAGRLEKVKRFDSLISAFHRAAAAAPGWRLVILGEGPERPALEQQAVQLGLGNAVVLPGVVTNVLDHFRRAACFALTSEYEGFPNSMLEAMSCGVPVLSFDCPCGPREILRGNEGGLLLPDSDIEALAEALSRVMQDEPLRRRLGDEARRMSERFSLERVGARWDRLLESVVAQG